MFVDIKNYEGLYKIDENGNIMSLSKKKNGEFIKWSITEDGYAKVCLSKNNKSKKFYIHRLVALHFIDNPNNLPQVNHIDCDKLNNNVDNLEWCTKEENQNHAVENNLMEHGENRASSKLKEEQIIEIYKLKDLPNRKLAKIYNVSYHTIGCILRGEKWKYLYKQYFNSETI